MGHNCVSHDYISHHYIRHNYTSHNYISHNYISRYANFTMAELLQFLRDLSYDHAEATPQAIMQ